MPLVSLVVMLIVLGLLLYLAESLPIAPPFKLVIRVVVVLGAILWLLQVFNLTLPVLR